MNYFYVTGVDITNDKSMFNFVKDHFTYDTLNSWNHLRSIANNVKIYNLGLSGNCWTALTFLNKGHYDILNDMIRAWDAEHPSYMVFFNGRSDGYLVLGNVHNNRTVLPDCIDDSDTYEDYKEYCKEYYGSVKNNRNTLVEITKLIQDFDKLCDDLRDYCDRLSNLDMAKVALESLVDLFNTDYADDLKLCGFAPLEIDEQGFVDTTEISKLWVLKERFNELLRQGKTDTPLEVQTSEDNENKVKYIIED